MERQIVCPKCDGRGDECPMCEGAKSIEAPTKQQWQVLKMMATGKTWAESAAFVYDTTTGAIIARHGFVRRKLMEYTRVPRTSITTATLTEFGRLLATCEPKTPKRKTRFTAS